MWPKEQFRLSGFVLVMSCIAWTVAFVLGAMNFNTNFEPYYDITALNKYPHVDPSVYHGQQFVDAGQMSSYLAPILTWQSRMVSKTAIPTALPQSWLPSFK